MKITRVDVVRVPLALTEPYTIAYETVDSAENVFVRLVTDGPHVGLGCAGPDEGVTGETVDTCEAGIRAAAQRLVGEDPLRIARCLEAIQPLCVGAPAARAACDMALHDLLGKAAGLPVYRLLGGYRSSIATSITVYIGEPQAMAERARAFVSQGFTAIKLKGGRAVDEDLEALRLMRRAVGPGIGLRFDANQGWDLKQTRRFIAGAEALDLELLEQPLPRGHGPGLATITADSTVPIMADESLIGLSDAFRLARGSVVNMINIKLMKVGGLDSALAVNAVARAAGYDVMVGCMDESAIAIAAGLHFALARPNVLLADLDGHLDLLNDPAAGAVILRDGVLYPSEEPGFGVKDLETVFA